MARDLGTAGAQERNVAHDDLAADIQLERRRLDALTGRSAVRSRSRMA
ncbi:MAG: hypothetical protein ACLSHG_10555 [Oscillospiraceae bacterium]